MFLSKAPPEVIVGFQTIDSNISELISMKFACVIISSGKVVTPSASVRFYTQDGTAVGEFGIHIH